MSQSIPAPLIHKTQKGPLRIHLTEKCFGFFIRRVLKNYETFFWHHHGGSNDKLLKCLISVDYRVHFQYAARTNRATRNVAQSCTALLKIKFKLEDYLALRIV